MTSSTSSAIGTGSRIGALATVSIVAGKEFRDCLRSRWLVFGSALFAILGLAVFFGTAAIGGTLQYQPLPSVMNSLLSLTVFLLPLLALLLSYDAFVGEAESGTLLLMLTYPLSRLQWLAGKALGQGAALLLVLVLGFAVLPLIQAFLPVPYGMGELLSSLCVLVLSGWALGLLFMLAAYWVSLSVRHKAQALALLLVVWFVAVLLYDLGLLVVTVAGADVLGRGTLTALMLANPASVFRLLNQSVSVSSPSRCRPLRSSRAFSPHGLRCSSRSAQGRSPSAGYKLRRRSSGSRTGIAGRAAAVCTAGTTGVSQALGPEAVLSLSAGLRVKFQSAYIRPDQPSGHPK